MDSQPMQYHIFMAKIAEQAERYDEMSDQIKEVAKLGKPLCVEVRNLLSVAFKNAVGSRRASWRIIVSIEQKHKGKDEMKENCAKEYRLKIEKELVDICTSIINLLDEHLLPSVEKAPAPPDGEKAKIDECLPFYLKMKGDYYRYIAELTPTGVKSPAAVKAEEAYTEATVVCKAYLPPTHPIRLGLALNHSVFYYEILNLHQKACELAHEAFDDAILDLDQVGDDYYKDSTLIMQLIRDNLTLWQTEAPTETDPCACNPDKAEQQKTIV